MSRHFRSGWTAAARGASVATVAVATVAIAVGAVATTSARQSGQTKLIYGIPTGMAWLPLPKANKPVPIAPNSAGVYGLEHTHVITQNLERSMHFYVDVMGFRQVMAIQDIGKDPPMNKAMNTLLGFRNATFRHAIVQMPGGASYASHAPQIEFWEVHGAPVDNSLNNHPTAFMTGKGYNSYMVTDLDALLARMRAEKIRFVSEKLGNAKDGSGIYVVDPDGQIIELNQVAQGKTPV